MLHRPTTDTDAVEAQAAIAEQQKVEHQQVIETKKAADEKMADAAKQKLLRPTTQELTQEELEQIRKLKDEELLKLRTELAAKTKAKSDLIPEENTNFFGRKTKTGRFLFPEDKLQAALDESQLVIDAKYRLELQSAQKEEMRTNEKINLPGSTIEDAERKRIANAHSSTGLIYSKTFVNDKTNEAPYFNHLKKELEHKHNTRTAIAEQVSKQNEVNAQIEYTKDAIKLKRTSKHSSWVENNRVEETRNNYKADQAAKSKPWFTSTPQTAQANAAAFIAEKEKAAKLQAEKDKAATSAPTPTNRRP